LCLWWWWCLPKKVFTINNPILIPRPVGDNSTSMQSFVCHSKGLVKMFEKASWRTPIHNERTTKGRCFGALSVVINNTLLRLVFHIDVCIVVTKRCVKGKALVIVY
jgi:hypothetical protein